MSRHDTWMPLYVADYLAATSHLTGLESGAYLHLLMAAWTRGGVLPDDDAVLARLARLTPQEWRRVRPAVADFWTVWRGDWTQGRLTEELEHAREIHAKRVASGRMGGRPPGRSDKQTDNRTDNRTDNQTVKQEGTERPPQPQPQPHTPTVPSEPTGGKSVARERAPARTKAAAKTPLPADFAISDRVKAWASDKGHSRLDERLEHFVGKARANGYRYVDWDEAFMAAIRDDWAKLDGKPAGAAAGRLTPAGQQTASALQRWVDDDGEKRDGTYGS